MAFKLRKVLIKNGTKGEKEIFLTDTPVEEIETLLRGKRDLWSSNGYVKFLTSSRTFDSADMEVIGWDEEYNIVDYVQEETHWYDLCYFYTRKDTGSWYVKTDADINSMAESVFLDYLMLTGKITYEQASHVYEVHEITEEEYKSFKDEEE